MRTLHFSADKLVTPGDSHTFTVLWCVVILLRRGAHAYPLDRQLSSGKRHQLMNYFNHWEYPAEEIRYQMSEVYSE